MEELLLKALIAAQKASLKIINIYQFAAFDVQIKEDNSPLTKADLVAHNIIVEELKNTDIPILSEEGNLISYLERKKWKQLWIIDPLDGTKEFIKKNGEFTVNIALVEDGVPVLGVVYVPVGNLLYYAAEGIGSFFSINPQINSLESLINNSKSLPYIKSEIYTVVTSRSHLDFETQDYIKQLEYKKGEIKVISKGSSLKLCMVADGTADEYPRFGPIMEWDTAAGHAVALYSGAKIVEFESGIDVKYNKESLYNPNFKVVRP